MRAFARRAIAARRDPSLFFEMVMREEFTHEPLVTLPHQRLAFEFILAHPRCVVRMPVGFSKTYMTAALVLFFLGTDPTTRAALISSSAGQAEKPLGVVSSYIDEADIPELRAVFPALRRTARRTEKWTQSAITVDRPIAIRDASCSAMGIGSKLILGSRLKLIVVDDILDEENTATADARRATNRWFFQSVDSRSDPRDTRAIVTNVPWADGAEPDKSDGDLTYYLEAMGWPSLTMDVWGNCFIRNTDWDTDLVRPSFAGDHEDERGPRLRLTEHDAEQYGAARCAINERGTVRPLGLGLERLRKDEEEIPFDIDDVVPLWPEKFPRDLLEEQQARTPPHIWAMHREMRTRSDDGSHCERAWIELCKENARGAGVTEFAERVAVRGNLVVSGVDIGIGLKEKNDRSSIVTAELLPELEFIDHKGRRILRNARKVLDVDSGRWPGHELVNRILDKVARFDSIVAVETNAAQDLVRQWAIERDVSVPVEAFVTGRNKNSRLYGVESLLYEFKNGAWLFPNQGGRCPKTLQKLIDEAVGYTPGKHTGDSLMACWICREKIREKSRAMSLGEGAVGMGIMAR